jgi:hypothetical protein
MDNSSGVSKAII